jgi:hypothetical protein
VAEKLPHHLAVAAHHEAHVGPRDREAHQGLDAGRALGLRRAHELPPRGGVEEEVLDHHGGARAQPAGRITASAPPSTTASAPSSAPRAREIMRKRDTDAMEGTASPRNP